MAKKATKKAGSKGAKKVKKGGKSIKKSPRKKTNRSVRGGGTSGV